MILHVILLLAIAALSEQCKYLKFNPEHSFCKPRNAKCKIFDAKVTEEDKTLLLKLHNEYRSKIASGKEPRAGGMPPAANMLEMVKMHAFIS